MAQPTDPAHPSSGSPTWTQTRSPPRSTAGSACCLRKRSSPSARFGVHTPNDSGQPLAKRSRRWPWRWWTDSAGLPTSCSTITPAGWHPLASGTWSGWAEGWTTGGRLTPSAVTSRARMAAGAPSGRDHPQLGGIPRSVVAASRPGLHGPAQPPVKRRDRRHQPHPRHLPATGCRPRRHGRGGTVVGASRAGGLGS
jgi:hypothetical protein